MNTRIREMLGVDFPILAFTHCRDVVAAVSMAGTTGTPNLRTSARPQGVAAAIGNAQPITSINSENALALTMLVSLCPKVRWTASRL